jgi:benzylsuccinate CoA-transferase BbsE subunit
VREVVSMTADSADARGSGSGAPDPEEAAARPGRVLEISDDEGSAAWCGQLFVRAGFTVTKAESARRPPPDQASDLFLNAGKARVTAELGSAELRDLAAGHDLVVTDASAADTRRHGLLDLPAAVVASITPFGLTGPYADWAATDATLMALGGHTFLSGDIGRAPLTMPGRYPAYQAGNFAFVAAGASLLSGGPARVEVSVLECLATLHQFTDTMWTEDGIVRGRHGNRWANLAPMTLLPAPDGWFMINITPNFWAPFTRMIGREELSAPDHPWSVSENRVRDADEIDQVVLAAIGDWPKERIFREGQGTWRVPFGYVQTMREVLDDPHLAERQFWRAADGPAGAADAPVVLPGSPYRFHHADGPAARPASPAGPAPVSGTAAGRDPDPGPVARLGRAAGRAPAGRPRRRRDQGRGARAAGRPAGARRPRRGRGAGPAALEPPAAQQQAEPQPPGPGRGPEGARGPGHLPAARRRGGPDDRELQRPGADVAETDR